MRLRRRVTPTSCELTSVLHEASQAFQRLVPLFRDAVEILMCIIEPGGLLRVVDGRIQRARMPAVREEALRLDVHDGHVKRDMRVLRVRELAAHCLAGLERAIELHAEPLPELLSVGERPPHSAPWCAE